jgi:alpha-tubulin suppressor-like RCC1 family protein
MKTKILAIPAIIFIKWLLFFDPCHAQIAHAKTQIPQNWIATVIYSGAHGGVHHLIRESDGTLWVFVPGGTMQQVEGIDHVISVVADKFTCMALKDDGTVWVWGELTDGQIGDPTVHLAKTDVPMQVPHLHNVVAIATTGRGCYALLKDSTVMAWGSETHLGYYEMVQTQRPTRWPELTKVVDIKGDIALKADGTVWVWGSNNKGRLGLKGVVRSSVPVPIPGVEHAVAISSRNGGGMALLADGTVRAWGDNQNGELGNGRSQFNAEFSGGPVKVSNITNVVAISAYSSSCFALLANGDVMAWGDGRIGALGVKSNEANNIPVKISALHHVVAIQSGIFHGFALLEDGTVMGWGSNMVATGVYHQVYAPIVITKLGDKAPR